MPSSPSTPIGRPAAALAGVVAAGAGLAAGELVAGLTSSASSPVISIGNRVVDAVPRPLKDLAIDLFGTNDKIALIVGIVLVLAIVAAGLGVLARARPRVAAGGAVVLALVAIAASAIDPTAQLPLSVLPSLATGLVAVPALPWLVHGRLDVLWQGAHTRDDHHDPELDDDAEASDVSATGAGPSRRRFIVASSSVLAASLAAAGGGRLLGRRFDVAAERSEAALPRPGETAPDVPAAAHPDVDGLSSFITPNDDFYRIDTALTVPQLSATGWTLRVHGMVESEQTFTYDEILAMPSVERDITMTCVSNQVGGDLVGTATWQGVPLSMLLDQVGVDPAADQLVGRAFDGFTTGFPVAEVAERETLLVYGMNGEPLPEVHGYPLRLVTPGLYGYVSATKWLSEVELTTFDAFDQYWVERGWDQRAPIKLASRIDTPSGFANLSGTVAVAGVAWAQTRGIERVEVRVDDGDFQEAELADGVNDDTWRQWVWRWDTSQVEPGRHSLTVRATDRTGEVQTEDRAEPFPNGASGWHRVVVFVGEDE